MRQAREKIYFKDMGPVLILLLALALSVPAQDTGIVILADTGAVVRQLPFTPDSWQRFYFQLDCPGPGSAFLPRWDNVTLATYEFSMQANQASNHPHVLILLSKGREGSGGYVLVARLRTSDRTELTRSFETPISANRLHCVETHVRFPVPDSIELTLFLDGDSLWKSGAGYYSGQSYFYISGNIPAAAFRKDASLHFQGFAMGHGRLHTLPPRPGGCSENVRGNEVTLRCAPFATGYRGETQTAVRWRLWEQGRDSFALFDMVDPDPAYYSSRPIPFPLDSGVYSWQVSFRNNFGHWGEESEPRTFEVRNARRVEVRLKQVFLAARGGKEPATEIEPGRPYDMVIRTGAIQGWAKMGYIIAHIRHISSLIGHPGNGGGYTDPGINYKVNLSFEDSPSGEPRLVFFERFGQVQPRQVVSNGDTSMFILGNSPEAIRLDTVKGEIRFSLRLLEQALPGPWQITSFLVDSGGVMSNLVFQPFTVVPVRRTKQTGSVWAFAVAAIILAGFFLLRKKKSTAYDADLKRITNYLEMRLGEELSLDKVRGELHFSVHGFHKTLKRNGIESLPKLLNNLRIEKAKEMLSNPGKNISEIGFEVGFGEARYFTKVFKDYTGQTPSEFRKKAIGLDS